MAILNLGNDSSGRPTLVDDTTKAKVDLASERLGFTLTITQGSYVGGAGAVDSAGTHDGGGVVDLRVWDIPESVGVLAVVLQLRLAGMIAWLRTVAQGFDEEHIHAIDYGNPNLSSDAQDQVTSYEAGGNGLASGGPDDGPQVAIPQGSGGTPTTPPVGNLPGQTFGSAIPVGALEGATGYYLDAYSAATGPDGVIAYKPIFFLWQPLQTGVYTIDDLTAIAIEDVTAYDREAIEYADGDDGHHHQMTVTVFDGSQNVVSGSYGATSIEVIGGASYYVMLANQEPEPVLVCHALRIGPPAVLSDWITPEPVIKTFAMDGYYPFRGAYSILQGFGATKPGTAAGAAHCAWRWAVTGDYGSVSQLWTPNMRNQPNEDPHSTWTGDDPGVCASYTEAAPYSLGFTGGVGWSVNSDDFSVFSGASITTRMYGGGWTPTPPFKTRRTSGPLIQAQLPSAAWSIEPADPVQGFYAEAERTNVAVTASAEIGTNGQMDDPGNAAPMVCVRTSQVGVDGNFVNQPTDWGVAGPGAGGGWKPYGEKIRLALDLELYKIQDAAPPAMQIVLAVPKAALSLGSPTGDPVGVGVYQGAWSDMSALALEVTYQPIKYRYTPYPEPSTEIPDPPFNLTGDIGGEHLDDQRRFQGS